MPRGEPMRGLVVGWLLLLSRSALGADAPGLDTLTRHLLAETLAPVLEVAEAEYPDAAFSLRAQPGKVTASGLLSGYADVLLERGREVYELAGRGEVPAGALLLEVTPLDVAVVHGSGRRGFLGLGAAKSERTARLHVRLRLTEPSSGRLLFDEERSVRRVDWVDAATMESPVGGDPLYVAGTSTTVSTANVARASWTERAVAVGVLGGIILIYFAGSS